MFNNLSPHFLFHCANILALEKKITTCHPQRNVQVNCYNRTMVSRLRMYVADNQWNWDTFVQTSTYAYKYQPHRSTNNSLFSLTPKRLSPGQVPVYSPTVLLIGALEATMPKGLRVRLLAKLVTVFQSLSGNLRQNQCRYKHSFDQKDQAMPKFSFEQLVHVDRSPLVTSPTDSKADKFKKLLPRAYGLCQILQITEQTITVDENGVPRTISVYRATPIIGSTSQPCHLKASKTSF